MTQRRFVHTLSGRLTLLFIGIAVLFVLVVGAGMGRAFRGHFESTVRPHLYRYMAYIRNDIGTPPDIERAAALARELPVTIQVEGPDGVWASDARPVDLGAVPLNPRASRRGRLYLRGELEGREYLVQRRGDYTLALSVPAARSSWRVWLPLAALLVVLVVLYQATRLLFRPIGEIRAGVERIGAGELDHRLDVRRRDELGDLAGSINAMAEQIRRMLEAKRQLLLAISHELRSPLTRAKVAVALLDDSGQRQEITRDLDELEHLIEELLEIERLSGPHRALERRPTSLNTLVQETLASFFAGHAVRRHLPADEVHAQVDAPRVKLLLKNLLDNALRHTPAGKPPPEVSLAASGAQVTLAVRDAGSGIAAEHLPHVTEPFYRADPARRRDTGGYGLGLYLCRVIAEAHGGELAIESRVGHGTSVRVTLPATA